MVTPFAIFLAMSIPAQSPLVSPEVHPDRTVTFRFAAVNAKKVALELEGSDELAMKQDAAGVWAVTTKPLEPDIYGYSFSVDGVGALDPLNPVIKPNLLWLGNLVVVPGKTAREWETQDVPHGTLHRIFYKSALIGDQRDAFIYTPPGYESSQEKLPVLYLFHGYSDTANGWTAVGQAHVVLDNLIAEGRAKPMIVVMPLGYGVPDFANATNPGFASADRTRRNYQAFRDSLFQELMPRIERDFRTNGRRAVAGLSMGGAETLFVGLGAPTEFEAIGAFSSGGIVENAERMFGKLDTDAINRFRLFYLACGTDDGLIQVNREIQKWLTGQGIRVKLKEQPGRHTWMVWRRDLIAFASGIFKD